MKAILVVDMPKNCKDCKLTYLDTGDDAYYGRPIQRCIFDDAEVDANERYYDCPLKPMPKKYIEHDITIETERDAAVCSHGITLGHNDVIKELEKPETKSDLSTDEGWWKDYELYEMQND